ncbi:armadillo-type protein [Morchella snyderi]|nr:armadillo-type protein [Morchella snyderi]
MNNSSATIGENIETLRRNAFQQLKPSCIAVSHNILTSRPNAQALTLALANLYSNLQSVSNLDPNVINNSLGDYVFFPLSHVFRQHQTLNDRALELGLQCLEVLIRTCWRLNIETELAKQLIVLITFIIGGAVPGVGTEGKKRSEETNLAGMKCLLALFESLGRTRKGALADVQYLPSVGHTVTTVLGVLFESTSSIDLQITALDAIAALLFRSVDEDDIIASFYPGLVSGLVKVIGLGKTTKRPYQALRNTVKLLTRIICRVLGDKQTLGLPSDESAVELITEGPAETPRRSDDLKVHRTTAWLKATSLNTKTALENVLRLRTHPKCEVRKAVFELCRDLLEFCRKSLVDANAPLVESMIVFSGDEEDQGFARLAESTLHISAALNQNIKEAIQASLHGWIVALPRVMGGNDEDAKTRLITRLSASFKLLADIGLETNLLQDMLADNIRDSLIGTNSSSTRTEITLQPVDDKQISLELLLANKDHIGGGKVARFPDVVLGHRSQIGTVTSMKRLLALLGGSSETALTLAQRHIRESSRGGAPAGTRATSLWIAVQLLRGSLETSAEVDEFFDLGITSPSGLQQRVTDELFSVSLSVLGDATEAATALKPGSLDSMLQCLALESLSLIAQAQKESFRGNLVDALYPVVHLLGAPFREAQTHAIVALNNIAHFCAYPSAKDMLLDNVDYMVNAVALKLNTFDLSLQTPVVLRMMVKLAGANLVPYLDDMVVSIFSALDSFHGYEGLCEALFGVLGEIVEESAKAGEFATITYVGEVDRRVGRKVKGRHWLTREEMLSTLRQDADKERPRVEPLEETEPDGSAQESFPREPWGNGKDNQRLEGLPDDDENEGSRPGDQVIKPTKSYELVQRITRLSQHYLTHDSPVLRTKLLRLVTTASPLLAGNEDEFLPLVNDIWPVVINRLFEDESHVVVATADAVSQLTECCGGFMTSRINESWPNIKRGYIKAYKELEKERRIKSGSLGVYSPHFKKWDAFCRLLTSVAANVPVSDEVIDEMCEIFGAKNLIERDDVRWALERVNADAIWLEIESWKFANGDSLSYRDLPTLEGVVFIPVVFDSRC